MKMEKVKLTPTQQKFFDAVIDLINSDPELIFFARKKATGKTTVFNFIDSFLSNQEVNSIESISKGNITNNFCECFARSVLFEEDGWYKCKCCNLKVRKM